MREIKFDRYRIVMYFGPPYEYKEMEDARTYAYMLNIPYPLSEEQMKVILQVIKEFERTSRPHMDGVMLVDGRIGR